MGEKIILLMFPNIQWWMMIKSEYLLFYLAVLFFVSFLYIVLKKYFNKIIYTFIMVIGLSYCFVFLLMPINIFVYSLEYYQTFTIIVAIYSMYVVIKAVINKYEGSNLILLASIFLIIAGINDILYARKLIDTGLYVSHALLTFSLFQTVFVAIKNSRVHEESIYYAKKTKRDGLTGLLNHNAIIEVLESTVLEDEVNGIVTSVAMIDIDFFKRVNDNYGHQVGDEVLVELSKLLSDSTRSLDFVGRYGGEEFLMVFPETEMYIAYMIVERIRAKVENMLFAEGKIKITISAGVSGRL
jgi:diguanylate cyclase (GGDEF)-like protein